MKTKLLPGVLCCLLLSCGADRGRPVHANEPEPNPPSSIPPSAEANTTPSTEASQPGANDKKVEVAVCLLSGETEDSCLAYRFVEAVVSPGLEAKDLAQKNYTLTCTAPVGGALSSCKAFRAEVKK